MVNLISTRALWCMGMKCVLFISWLMYVHANRMLV